jgi:hypothetical protein
LKVLVVGIRCVLGSVLKRVGGVGEIRGAFLGVAPDPNDGGGAASATLEILGRVVLVQPESSCFLLLGMVTVSSSSHASIQCHHVKMTGST